MLSLSENNYEVLELVMRMNVKNRTVQDLLLWKPNKLCLFYAMLTKLKTTSLLCNKQKFQAYSVG